MLPGIRLIHPKVPSGTIVRSAIHVLDLISVDGAGGGAEKIVLRTAAKANPDRFTSTMCCLRYANDSAYDMDVRARGLNIDYCEVVTHSKFDRRAFAALRRIVRDRRIDIVHAHGYKSAYFASRLARAEGIKPISTSHGWTGHHWRERFLYYPADRLIIRTFPMAIAVSSQIRNTLIQWRSNPERIRVVLNGIDQEKYRRNEQLVGQIRDSLGIQPGEIVLGASGRIEPQKRFDVFLETMALLLPRRPELKLLIVGEGSLRHKLVAQIKRLGVGDHCRLLGHRGDMADLYHAFDVLVQSSDYEGTPTVVVEAMALGIPVVATDAGGTAELLDDTVHGLIVPRRDPAALARAIEKTIDAPEQTAQRVAAARRRVETDLSFDARMRTLERIYSELVDA